MLKNYFKIAYRNLVKNKIYSFINIAGLSTGLACAMLIILYVKDEVSYDRFHTNANRIYRIVAQSVNEKEPGKTARQSSTGFLQGPRFGANVLDIQSFVRVGDGQVDIRKGVDISSHSVLKVDAAFFQVFSFPLLQGNRASCLKRPDAIVLSQDEAQKQFGSTDVVGKTLMVKIDSTFQPCTVTAVASRCPQNSSIKFDILLPFNASPQQEQNSENWFASFLNTFVLLPPNANISAIETKMQRFYEADARMALQVMEAKYGHSEWVTKYKLQPFASMHLSNDLGANNGLSDASNPMYSYILSGIALFILLIACINFVNLTVARSVKRAREIGIRKVVGGDRKQLIAQFLGESFLLCLIAFVLSVLIVQLILPVFNDLSNKSLAIAYLFDVKLVTGYIILFLLTGFLAGFYPALILSGYNPVQTLYSRFTLSGKNHLQKSLVVFQFVLASFLIIVTLTIYSQFNYLTTFKLGYDDSHLVTINKWPFKRSEAILLRNELLKNNSITEVAFRNGGRWITAAKINGDSPIQFAYETVDASYIPLLKIPVIQGRNFSPAYPSDSTHAVLVNEAFVKKAGWKQAIGQQLNFWYNDNEKYTVAGVVKDYHFQPLNEEIGPQVFTMKPANDYAMAWIKIKAGQETSALRHIEVTFKKLFPLSPYSYTFKDDDNRRSYEAEAKWKQIMLFGAILTILISCIGLFGLSVLSAEKRTKEIGIRKILGASVGNVVGILSKDFIKLVIIALVTAMPLAWLAGNKWLQNYPYRITPGWGIFSAAAVLVIVIAVFTISFQAVRAATSNPVKSLRTE